MSRPLRMHPVNQMGSRTASPRPEVRTESPISSQRSASPRPGPQIRSESPKPGRASAQEPTQTAPPHRSVSPPAKGSPRPDSPVSQLQSEFDSPIIPPRTDLLPPRIASLDFSESPPPVPPKDDNHKVSPLVQPSSPRSLVSHSTFSLGRSRVSSMSTTTQTPTLSTTARFQPPKPIDTSHPKRALSPLAPDSAYSTGSKFTMSTRDSIDKPLESPSRPTTSRSTKPFSRSRLALFPTTAPSLASLRGRSELTLPLNGDKTDRGNGTGGDDGIGEEAESALPATTPRTVRKVGSMGMLKKFGEKMGFARRRTAVDVGP